MPNVKGCKKVVDLQEILDNLYPNTYHVTSSTPEDKGCKIKKITGAEGGWTTYMLVAEFKSNKEAYEKVIKRNICPDKFAVTNLLGETGTPVTGRDEAQKVVDYFLAIQQRAKFTFPEMIRKDIDRVLLRCREYTYSKSKISNV